MRSLVTEGAGFLGNRSRFMRRGGMATNIL